MTEARRESDMLSDGGAVLQVPDHASEKDFLAAAKRIWRKAHPEKRRNRGRPSERSKVFEVLDSIVADAERWRTFSQGKLIKLVQERLQNLSQDTIWKHVRDWRERAMISNIGALSPKEKKWLRDRHREVPILLTALTLLEEQAALRRERAANPNPKT